MACRFRRRAVVGVGVVWLAAASVGALGQDAAKPEAVTLPEGVTSLEGLPAVSFEITEQGVTRRVLGQAEAAKNRLKVSVVDGQYRWSSRDNRPLQLLSSGEFTYLSSEPGSYIRLTRFKDRVAYVEHVDSRIGIITYWGELEIVVRK